MIDRMTSVSPMRGCYIQLCPTVVITLLFVNYSPKSWNDIWNYKLLTSRLMAIMYNDHGIDGCGCYIDRGLISDHFQTYDLWPIALMFFNCNSNSKWIAFVRFNSRAYNCCAWSHKPRKYVSHAKTFKTDLIPVLIKAKNIYKHILI